jgi:hypothetical protein
MGSTENGTERYFDRLIAIELGAFAAVISTVAFATRDRAAAMSGIKEGNPSRR